MTKTREIADRIAGDIGPFSFVTKEERNVVVSALRAAARPAAPICCYCDAVLSCAACGREQPDDSLTGEKSI